MYRYGFAVFDSTDRMRLSNADEIFAECIGCNLCQKDCAFLAKYGNPLEILQKFPADDPRRYEIAFECSLCGLCGSVCPKNLDISGFFLDLRRNAVQMEMIGLNTYKRILNFEKKGNSDRYGFHYVPPACDTVFFPGCNLPGSRPGKTLKCYGYIREVIPDAGIVLGCCAKPSHDLGRKKHFESVFSTLVELFAQNGIKRVVVACPNCHKVFRTYAGHLDVRTIYELMAENGISSHHGPGTGIPVNIHDPCSVRFERDIHESVRYIAGRKGLEIRETAFSREKTFCCGEGGAVGCVAPELSQTWASMRINDSETGRILTYCAGCVDFLGRKSGAFHLLDLLFEPEKVANGNWRISRPPFTYLNRIKLKRRLKRNSSVPVPPRDLQALF